MCSVSPAGILQRAGMEFPVAGKWLDMYNRNKNKMNDEGGMACADTCPL